MRYYLSHEYSNVMIGFMEMQSKRTIFIEQSHSSVLQVEDLSLHPACAISLL